METQDAPVWPSGFTEPVEDRHALAAAAARWFAPIPAAPGGEAVRRSAATDGAATRTAPRQAPADVPRSVAVQLSAIWLLLRTVSSGEVGGLEPPLTNREFASLHLLQTTGPLRVIDVGDLLQMDKSTTSRVVRGLLGRRLLDRTPHPTDGRAFLVELSAAGREVLETSVADRGFSLASVLGDWDSEARSDLLQALNRLREEWTTLMPDRWRDSRPGDSAD